MLKRLLSLFICLFLLSCSSDSENEIPQQDATPPDVEISFAGFNNDPGSGPLVVGNQLQVNIDASDTSGIAKVEAFIDDEKVGEDNTAPYQITIDLSGFSSKLNHSDKFMEYTLRIVVTDNAGNTASEQQIITIDNESPVIIEVSLETGEILNGDTNPVFFDVVDNEGLTNVKAYVNGELITEITDGNYELNINTQNLEDGEKTLRIEALDLAENTAIYEVNFISDNTGPQIDLDALVDEQVVDLTLVLNPNIEDTFSSVQSVQYFLGDELQLLIEDSSSFSWELDPENFVTGNSVFSIVARDDLGNETVLAYTIEIQRRLITIKFPEQSPNSERLGYYIFASGSNGELLGIKEVAPENNEVILSTLVDIKPEEEFMITFADRIFGRSGETNEFTTIQNIKRGSVNAIDLKSRPQFRSNLSPLDPRSFQIDPSLWYTDQDLLNLGSGGSFDHTVFNTTNNAFSENPPSEEFSILRFENIANGLQSDKVFLSLQNFGQGIGSHTLIDIADLTADFVIEPSLFDSEGFERREVIISNPGPGSLNFGSIKLRGYLNQEDFQNNVSHRIESAGFDLSVTNNGYWFSSLFETYMTTLRIKNFVIEGLGAPLTEYSGSQSSLSYTFSENEFLISKNTDAAEVLGQVLIADHFPPDEGGGTFGVMNGQEQTYKWSLIFNPSNNDNIKLPEIPDELKEWRFYQNYLAGEHEFKQVELRTYDNISSFDEYLDSIIKNNAYWYLVSPRKSIIYSTGDDGAYSNPGHFLLD